MAVEDRFIGVGWSFPPVFDAGTAAVRMTGGIEDIENSLRIILGTVLGERVMRPEFGCNLDDQLFEAMNSSRLTYIENLVRTAILYHEARIDADAIAIAADQAAGRLDITVSYRVRGANSRFNFVHPYYLTEG